MTEWTYNIGEWSELYVLFKLLHDKELVAGDEYGNPVEGSKLFVKSIIQDGITFRCGETQAEILVTNHEIKQISNVELSEILLKFAQVLVSNKKKKSPKGAKSTATIPIPEIEIFARKIGISKVKAKSRSKQDIDLVAFDAGRRLELRLSFSIKSQLGKASTLLNASGSTNIIWKIINPEFSESDLESINELFDTDGSIDLSSRFSILFNDFGLKLHKYENETFHENLLLVDSCMGKIFASLCLTSILEGENLIRKLTSIISQTNPVGYTASNKDLLYSKKISKLLLDIALGFQPAKPWSGAYEATGGYIIVKEDTSLVCYHIHDINLFYEYLLNNTKLDSPSTSRHKYGTVYKEGDNYFIKLNRQIRFVK